VVIRDWRGEYYNNPDLNGQPVLVRNDVAIGFDWGNGSPGPGVPSDNFSARWSRGLNFSAGNYRFYTRVDDGVRLWVDGSLIINQWRDSAPTTYSADIYLSGGWHNLRMEYYERTSGAIAQLAWEQLDKDQDEEDYPDWKAEYYDNRKLEGDPVLVRNEEEIDHDWGRGSPGGDVPDDNFSARWTQEIDFDGGTYLFKVRVDDGVRLWVDDDLVIDSWRDGSSRLEVKEHPVKDGKRDVEVEYYERRGGAEIEVSWKRQEPNQSPTAAPGGPYTVDEGSLLTLDGSGSRDPDGSIAKYEWDFRYDGQTFDAKGTGQTVNTGYEDGPATVTVALRVTDNDGASHLATTQVTVKNVAPVAEAGGPYAGQAEEPISIAGTATDPGSVDQAGLTYRWDFGDGSQGNGPNVSHSYDEAGDYTLTLTVIDKDGAQGTDTASVQVEPALINQPPTAVISGPTSGLVDETLNFDGSGSSDSDGSIISYAWNFGDGNTDNGDKVTHSYRTAGKYDVILTVTDDDDLGDTSTYTLLIEESITNKPPVAVINGPANALVNEPVIFDSGGSHDPNGTIVSYVWDFGDGGPSQLAELARSGASTLAHSYSTPGTYQVTLTVTDDGDLSNTVRHTIVVQEPADNRPPIAKINVSPAKALAGETISFGASDSSDPDGSVISYAWDFGDGNTDSGEKVTHSYRTAGKYDVILTVTDNGSLSNTASHTIVIEEVIPNRAPVAVINGPASALVGEPVIFDSGGSRDPDGTIVSYVWDFGDGGLSQLARSSESTLAHIYSAPGTYQVSLTVTDDGGLSDTAAHTIVIEEPAPSNQPPQAVIDGPTKGLVEEVLTFDASRSSDPDGRIVSYAWDFGDSATSNGVNVSHSYSTAGTYNVTLTVTDDGGLRDTSTFTLLIEEPVTNQPPVAMINGVSNGQVGESLSFESSSSSDSDGSIVSYAWDFGDSAMANGVNVSHSYNKAGNYNVTLTVTDDGGLSDTSTYTLLIEEPVTNQSPVAVINGTANGLVGESLSFDGSSSSDPDGSIVGHAWDFGDGNTDSGENVTHSYAAAMEYQVTLKVTDNDGSVDSTAHSVQVEEE
jgi:PKD repeat protein